MGGADGAEDWYFYLAEPLRVSLRVAMEGEVVS